ncbi:acid-sensing ion channel 5 isoform X5 [Drosophila yakuba]|nr:acid-sensing ion channel 5 isoform X5 [Drosophila yakuba]
MKKLWDGFHEYEMWRKAVAMFREFIRTFPTAFCGFIRSFVTTFCGFIRTFPSTFCGFIRTFPTTFCGFIRTFVTIFFGFIRTFVQKKGLLWIFVLGISGWSTVTILVLLKNRYETDSTTIGLSTAYLRWTNTFPSIAICLTKTQSGSEFQDAIKKRFGPKIPYVIIRSLYSYIFVNPNSINAASTACKKPNSCNFDIFELRREFFPTNCTVIFEKVYFREELQPDCEEIFKFHETEMGYCFLANNLLDYKSIEEMPLRYSSLEKHRNLRLILRRSPIYGYELYVNSPEDLPFFNALSYSISHEPQVHAFNVEEIDNHEGVIDEPVSQRKCKFPSESSVEGFPYSFSTCMSIIRSKFEMELCNCSLFSPQNRNESIFCGMLDLQCLDNAKLASRVKDYVGQNMACLPSCVEQQISLVGSQLDKNSSYMNQENVVDIQIASPPTARYHRTVTQTKLDLIVGIGSVVGLFFGASLLNLLEIISYFIKTVKTMVFAQL